MHGAESSMAMHCGKANLSRTYVLNLCYIRVHT